MGSYAREYNKIWNEEFSRYYHLTRIEKKKPTR